jgi:DNA-binding GntR family transcriptional regulator
MDLKVTPRPVQSQIANKLRDAILAGHFHPGQRLVETTLCEMINVSRSSLREALRRLEGEKLIVIVPNKGPSVANISWEEAEEIYHVRALLEGEAAALFAQRVQPADIKSMRSALRQFNKANETEDTIAKLQATNDFYEIILIGCQNRIIQEVLGGLLARINFLRSRSMAQAGRSRFSVKELNRILQAIETRNPATARKAAVDHVRSAAAAAKQMVTQKKA